MAEDDKKKINEQILGSVKSRAGSETKKWVAGLAGQQLVEDAIQAEAQVQQAAVAPGYAKDGHRNVTMTGWMDYLFHCFQQYEVEFNRAMKTPELKVTVYVPEVGNELVSESSYGKPITMQTYRGRVSTREWTMVIRGRENNIDGWIVPADKFIQLAASHNVEEPFLEMVAERDGNDLYWRVDDARVAWEDVRKFGKQLFGILIKVAKGERERDAKFSISSSTTLGHEEHVPQAAKPRTLTKEEAAAEFYSHDPNFDGISAGGAKTTPPSAPTQSVPGTAIGGKPKAAPDGSPVDQLELAWQNMLQCVETELNRLSDEGVKAFAKQDTAQVDKLLKRTNKLKQVRDQMNTSIAQWRSVLAEK